MSVARDESFLTVAEVAELLKINQQTVRNWIDHGTLPALRVGRRVRIKKSDLDRILEAGYRGGTTASPGRPGGGPSAEDFWSGEPVGMAEPDPSAPSAPDGVAESTQHPDSSDKSQDSSVPPRNGREEP